MDDPTSIQILGLVAKRAAREDAVLKGLAAIRHRPVSEIEPKFNAAIAAMRAGGLIECAGRRGEKEVRITALGQEWLKAAMRDRDEERFMLVCGRFCIRRGPGYEVPSAPGWRAEGRERW